MKKSKFETGKLGRRYLTFCLAILFLAPFIYFGCSGSSGDGGDQIKRIATLPGNKIGFFSLAHDGRMAWLDRSGDTSKIKLFENGSVKTVASSPDMIYQVVMNAQGQLAWSARAENSSRIFFYDGEETNLLSEGVEWPGSPDLNDAGQIVFVAVAGDGVDPEVYLHEKGGRKRLTEDGDGQMFPQINDNGQVSWLGYDDSSFHIYLYENGEARRVDQKDTHYFSINHKNRKRISNQGQIVWTATENGANKILLYDGGQIVQTSASNLNKYPTINNKGVVVWQCYDGRDWEICQYKNGRTTAITDNEIDDELPVINDQGAVAWQGCVGGDTEIFTSDTQGVIRQLTFNDLDDVFPQINNRGEIAWLTRDYLENFKGLYLAEEGSGQVVLPDSLTASTESGPKDETNQAAVAQPGSTASVADPKKTGDPPAEAAGALVFSFIVFGDSRGLDSSWAPPPAKQELYPERFLECLVDAFFVPFHPTPRFAVFLGDAVTHPQTSWTDSCEGSYPLKEWYDLLSDALRAEDVGFIPIYGNHETYAPELVSYGGHPFMAAYNCSVKTLGVYTEMVPWYWPNEKDVPVFTFVAFNQYTMRSNSDYDVGVVDKNQLNQLDAIMQPGERGHDARFLFAFGHAPIDNVKSDPFRKKLLDYDFSAYFGGHVHLYARQDLTMFGHQKLPQFIVGSAGTQLEDSATVNQYKADPTTEKVFDNYAFAHVEVFETRAVVTVYQAYSGPAYNHCYPANIYPDHNPGWVCADKIAIYPRPGSHYEDLGCQNPM